MKLGQLAEVTRRQDTGRARSFYQQGLEIDRKTAERLNIPEAWHRLAADFFNPGVVSAGDEREHYAMEAYTIWGKLLNDDPGNGTYLTCMDHVLEQLL